MQLKDVLGRHLARALERRLIAMEDDISDAFGRMEILERKIHRLEIRMAKDREALARLDEQIEALRAYVQSDEETDAAEVDRRTESLRQLLAEAQGSGQVTPEEAGEVESQLGEVLDEANSQNNPNSQG